MRGFGLPKTSGPGRTQMGPVRASLGAQSPFLELACWEDAESFSGILPADPSSEVSCSRQQPSIIHPPLAHVYGPLGSTEVC